MIHAITVNPDGTTTIRVDFTDEGVNLQGEIAIKGGEAKALGYVPIFEADLRRNYIELFPPAPPTEGGMPE
jgi:hypothetical protein